MDLKSKINYANRCNRKEQNHHLDDIDYKNVNPAKVINVASSTTTPSLSSLSSSMTTTTTAISRSSSSSQPNSNINRLHNQRHQNQHNSQHYHHNNNRLNNNNNNGNLTENNTNKRKRRITLDGKESEYENPAKRIYSNNDDHQSHSHSRSVVSSSSIHNDQLAAATEEEIISIGSSSEIIRSSSDCLSAVADYDLGTPCSSTNSRHDDDHDISPTATTLTSSSQSSATTYSSSNSGTDLVDQNVRDWQQEHQQQICDGDNLMSIDRKMKCDTNNDVASSTNTDDYCSSVCVTPETTEIPMCPLPALAWANAQDVWNLMCRNDEIAAYDRTASMLENHPGLQPRMRAILLDWLIELCEVYKLHRETYYLAVDYLDRYLAATKNVQKTHLQLIGITCLFVASKIEEIYPPKLAEFAYVTDGACQVEDILQHELLLLKALDWDVSPVTIMGWLGVYMQLNVSNRTPSCFSQNNTNSQPPSSHQRVMNSSREQSQQQQQQQNLQRNVGAAFNNNNNCSGLSNSSSCNSSSVDNRSNSLRVNVDSSCDDSSSFLTMTSANCNSSRTDVTTTGTMTTTIIDDSGVMLATPQSLMNDSNNPKNDDAFIYPQFSGMEFVQTAQLLDLCSMDVGMANFRYSVIAAAAMSYTFSRETALRVSGHDWSTIEECAKWMKPFFSVICEEAHHVFLLEQDEQVKTKYGLGHICPNIITDDSHIIQTHTTSMSLFDKLVLRREQLNTAKKIEASPAIGFVCPEGLLTPPSSSRKPPEDDDVDENVNGNDDIENENDDHDDGNDDVDDDGDEDNHYNHDHHNEEDYLHNDDIDHENDDYNLYGDLNDIIDDDYDDDDVDNDDDSGGDNHNENNVYKK